MSYPGRSHIRFRLFVRVFQCLYCLLTRTICSTQEALFFSTTVLLTAGTSRRCVPTLLLVTLLLVTLLLVVPHPDLLFFPQQYVMVDRLVLNQLEVELEDLNLKFSPLPDHDIPDCFIHQAAAVET